MELTNQQRASLSVITAAVASFHAVTELHVETYHEPTGVRKNPEEATLGARGGLAEVMYGQQPEVV